MPDTLTLAGTRPARLLRTPAGALELVGRSATIARVQEFVRRTSAVDGGVLLVAERGVDVESVARELHARCRPPTAPFVRVACHDEGVDRLLFGDLGGDAPSDLE